MLRALLTSIAVLALAACQPAGPAESPPLEGAAIGGEFDLVDSAGKAVHWADFAGKYRIVYFGYAYCPDVCPTDVQRFSKGLELFEEQDPARGAKIQPIFVTVDPERDTPEVVGEFASNFHPRLIGLTGTPEQIDAAAKAFAVFYGKGKTSEGGGYLVDHSSNTTLFDPDGKPLALLPTDQGPEAIAAELDKWVR
ncbi:SCO family protein [Tsuneonella sp. HG222]